ncbi:MAG TPA: SCO family protein [Bacteroidales bacterium]|jgi:protein SCO1/2|nr:SCO family protein [Bacteroidales bacterium]
MKTKNIINLILLLSLSIENQLHAEDPNDDNVEIGIIEKLNEYVPDDIILTDESGNQVNMKSLINKPTIITFVYFNCPMLCSPLMNGLSEVIDKTDLKPGVDYQVLTIGFNTAEPLSLAIAKKKNYVRNMKTKEAATGWKFFTSDSVNVAKATRAMGFRYKRAGMVFLHSATLIFVSPEGKITRYLNGTYFLPFEFKMALVESSKGQAGPTINKILQYCYGYDSQAQRYVLDITKVGGALILFILVGMVFWLILKGKPRKYASTGSQTT